MSCTHVPKVCAHLCRRVVVRVVVKMCKIRMQAHVHHDSACICMQLHADMRFTDERTGIDTANESIPNQQSHADLYMLRIYAALGQAPPRPRLGESRPRCHHSQSSPAERWPNILSVCIWLLPSTLMYCMFRACCPELDRYQHVKHSPEHRLRRVADQ